MTMYKKCSWHGCSKIIPDGVLYCEYHSSKYAKEEKERYKEYNKRRRQDKEQKKYQDFYNSETWKIFRKSIISSFYGLDIIELYRTGRAVIGERVHHIIPLEDNWNRRLDISNVIYITEKNHRTIHATYDKGEQDKKAMQRLLFELIKQFTKDYKD